MRFSAHPDLTITQYKFGNEEAPLLVIDDVVREVDELVQYSTRLQFVRNSIFYPGVRAEAPMEYRNFFAENLAEKLQDIFELPLGELSLSLCHYSLTTTPASELKLLQRIPHFDSLERNGLATVHYLFKRPLGGTAFYRHIKTGFESIDESRKIPYLASLESENGGPNIPRAGYINGDTALYKQIMQVDGVYNRMVVYRRNSLHSGCIPKDFVADSNPLVGRLSLNSFIDIKPD